VGGLNAHIYDYLDNVTLASLVPAGRMQGKGASGPPRVEDLAGGLKFQLGQNDETLYFDYSATTPVDPAWRPR